MKLKFWRQIFEKSWNIKFHENPSGGILIVPCEQTDGQRKDMTKIIVAFCNFANALNKEAQYEDICNILLGVQHEIRI